MDVAGVGARSGTDTANAASTKVISTGELPWESAAASAHVLKHDRATAQGP
jgi:hypothetical protein